MNLRLAWRKVRWSLVQRGLPGTIRAGVGALRRGPSAERTHPFDERYGTDTGGLIGGGALAVGSRNDRFITAYAGIAPSRLGAALDRWEATLAGSEGVSGFTFVDLGCGKGRAMLLASERPFREVLGVELNAGLAAIAEENARAFRGTGLPQTELRVVCRDATEVVYPAGSLLVFIYNSFGVPVVRAVLDGLTSHVRATGARVDLLFQNEGQEMPMRGDARLRVVWTGTLAMSEEDAAADPVASTGDVTSLYRWQ